MESFIKRVIVAYGWMNEMDGERKLKKINNNREILVIKYYYNIGLIWNLLLDVGFDALPSQSACRIRMWRIEVLATESVYTIQVWERERERESIWVSWLFGMLHAIPFICMVSAFHLLPSRTSDYFLFFILSSWLNNFLEFSLKTNKNDIYKSKF